MSTFYEEGPLWSPADCLPADAYRVKAFYRPREGCPTMEPAVCISGKWWAHYHQNEVPLQWQHMLDHRMRSDAETGGPAGMRDEGP